MRFDRQAWSWMAGGAAWAVAGVAFYFAQDGNLAALAISLLMTTLWCVQGARIARSRARSLSQGQPSATGTEPPPGGPPGRR